MNPLSASGSTVLIVGGTGRLGRILVRRFSACGWNIRVLTRNVPQARGFFPDLGGMTFVEADLSQPSSLKDVCRDCDLTIFAAGARRPAYATDPRSRLDFQQINVEALRFIGEAALKAGNRPLLHLGSLFAIGLELKGAIAESTEPHPITPFGKSERDGELALLELHRQFGLDCRILRLPPVTGAAPRGGLLDALRTAATDAAWVSEFDRFADTAKPLIAQADLLSAVDAILERGVPGRIYQFSSGDFSLTEIASGLRAIAFPDQPLQEYMFSHSDRSKAVDVFLRQYLRWDVRVATDRARKELGWTPAITTIQYLLVGADSGNRVDSIRRGNRDASGFKAIP